MMQDGTSEKLLLRPSLGSSLDYGETPMEGTNGDSKTGYHFKVTFRSYTFVSASSMARWHEERSYVLEALCCILLMTP